LNLLNGDLAGPECVGFDGLSDAVRSEVSILPAVGAVASLLTPVAVPGCIAVVGLSGVMIAFAMAADEEEFVCNVCSGITVELLDKRVEALPLG
jgi:hypothetical protein